MTECSKCGDCCERIGYWGDWSYLQRWVDWWEAHCDWAMHNLLDGEDGGVELSDTQTRTLLNAKFMLAHWRPAPEDASEVIPRFTCDMFDAATRLCTAHAARPPICRDFPWYGLPEREPRFGPRCSFWADVPLENRPGGNLRCLPVLNG